VRWKCGNRRSVVISKDCGKRGKRLYVFLSSHQAGISTAPSLRARSSRSVMCPRNPVIFRRGRHFRERSCDRTIRSMNWKHFIEIARGLLFLTLTVALLMCLWGSSDKQRKARPLEEGRIEFTPNRRAFWAWPVLVVYLIYATIHRLMHIDGRPYNILILVTFIMATAMIAAPFPASIIVTADGLEQVSWLWKNKRIRWADIVEVNTGGASHTVTITSADGTKIIHSSQLPDRSGLLMAIKNHCGENLPSDFPREPSAEPVSQIMR
jgi:Bacterial PH domain